MSTCLLNTSRDDDPTTSPESLFQCLITLLVKKFFLICNLNLPWSNLRPLLFCGHDGPKTVHSIPAPASPVLGIEGWSLPYSCWPHCSWYKSGCCWPAWLPGHTAGSYSASRQQIPPGPFLPGSFLATLPQACSIAWVCCDPTGPSTEPCLTSYNWPWPIDPVCPDPSAEPSYPQESQHAHPAWCHLQTYCECTKGLPSNILSVCTAPLRLIAPILGSTPSLHLPESPIKGLA